jgi:hypothetical protein
MVDFTSYPEWEQLAYKERIRINTQHALEQANERLEAAGLPEVPTDTPAPAFRMSAGKVFVGMLILGAAVLVVYTLTQPKKEEKKLKPAQ